ncbi:hypothetical protein MIND_00856200 [Mycena indigotica]|uniref:Uncharacterized protein n=1 Tax=Mycena indigotica TaxID=2126181 RepID=A0A8H6W4M1_9AGAR|nr:uncharacterized protein MIND_00856200 [Mycena indigotica]KAF7299079.1 hypothetical protein MIND_00856200 [Mycena indigotica]
MEDLFRPFYCVRFLRERALKDELLFQSSLVLNSLLCLCQSRQVLVVSSYQLGSWSFLFAPTFIRNLVLLDNTHLFNMLSYKTVLLALLFSSSSLALPIRREVPQEHSHEKFLRSVQASLVKNNPAGIVDSVFGLLGNAAASQGLGKIADPDCLQQATADQAFTNAKAAGDIQGQVDALIYRGLERNSGKVGATTAACKSIKAVNPEIAAISQHQDPASPNAAAVNKAITLEIAKQIASVGGNPLDALQAGTFAPGNLNDNTGKGNTCDDANDAVGCIISQNLLVEDASEAEIQAAVAGVSKNAGSANNNGNQNNNGSNANNGAAAAPPAASSSNIGNFGKCSVPQIEFGVGFDNRKETSFQPVDKQSFNHGSAQAIKIITQFICDTLTNSCGADATAKATCAKAQAAADAAPPKTGIDADIFNGFFGISTNFRNIAAVDDQGRVVAGSTGGQVSVAPTGGAGQAQAPPANNNNAASNNNQGNQNNNAVAAPPAASSSGIGNFGKCSVPQIEFGVGFDNRKETSFQPVDKKSFNHGSAQAIKIITQFICDTLTNSCGADATAKATCAKAQAAADAAPPKTGIDADIFNSFFGISTNFRNIAAIDDQGRVVAGSTGGQVSVAPTGGAGQAQAPPANTNKGGNGNANKGGNGNAASQAPANSAPAATGGNVQTFTGNLGGAAPPVVPGGKGFIINGSEFINKAGALGRSCDIQHNACANAANSGAGFSVSACDAQNTQCHNAIN